MLSFQDYLKLFPDTAADREQLINEAIKAVIALISSEVGYDIIKHQSSESYYMEFYNKIFLFRKPVISVDKVTLTNCDIKELDNYVFKDKVLRFETAYDPKTLMSVTYTAGFEEFPDWLSYFILSNVNQMLEMTENQDLTSYKIDTISYNFRKKEDFLSELHEICRKITLLL